MNSENLSKLPPPSIGHFLTKETESLLEIARKCRSDNPEDRPKDMDDIIYALKTTFESDSIKSEANAHHSEETDATQRGNNEKSSSYSCN